MTVKNFYKINHPNDYIGSAGAYIRKNILFETVIKITIEEGMIKRNIEIDNSSEFKDFVLNQENSNSNDVRTLSVENDTTNGNIIINGIVLNDIELKLLKEFINQTK